MFRPYRSGEFDTSYRFQYPLYNSSSATQTQSNTRASSACSSRRRPSAADTILGPANPSIACSGDAGGIVLEGCRGTFWQKRRRVSFFIDRTRYVASWAAGSSNAASSVWSEFLTFGYRGRRMVLLAAATES